MPIFAVVLAYNLARPDAFDRAAYPRVMQRLAIAGVLATPPFIALGGLGWGWWPLNIMFMLLVATGIMYLSRARHGRTCPRRRTFCRRRGTSSSSGGPLWRSRWARGVTFDVPTWTAFLLGLVGLAAHSSSSTRILWALAALPLFVLASRVDVPVPRLRWVFYAFYPLHLAGIWLVRNAA